jgi:hypothetical protein
MFLQLENWASSRVKHYEINKFPLKSKMPNHPRGINVIRKFSVVLCLFAAGAVDAQQTIYKNIIHLRDGDQREWNSFPEKETDSQLVVHFNAQTLNESSIGITQFDVNHTWSVLLNDKQLGILVTDEQKMVTYFTVPAGLLKSAENKLVIRPEDRTLGTPDDINISRITLHLHPLNSALGDGHVNIEIKDELGKSIPSRLTIINDDGALQQVLANVGDTLAVRTGVIYSGTGNCSFSLPAGNYKV